jgi:hypothetical protein
MMNQESRIKDTERPDRLRPGNNFIIRIRSKGNRKYGWWDWRYSSNRATIKRDLQDLDTDFYEYRVIYTWMPPDPEPEWQIIKM